LPLLKFQPSYHQEIDVGLGWIDLAQDSSKLGALVNEVMKFRVQ